MIYQTHPSHGKHISYNGIEAEANRNNGWKDVTKEEFYPTQKTHTIAKPIVKKEIVKDIILDEEEDYDPAREAAAKAYELKFGKRPHHRMGTDTILNAMGNNTIIKSVDDGE